MLWMDSVEIWWRGLVCDKNHSRLDLGSAPDTDPAYHWNTKRKLFSLAEMCSLPSGRSSSCFDEIKVDVDVVFTR